MGLPLLAGRGFTEQDVIGKPWRVDHQQARSPTRCGRARIRSAGPRFSGRARAIAGRVIGVVGDMRERGLEADPTLAVYFPAYGDAWRRRHSQLVIHTKRRAGGRRAGAARHVASVDPDLPISSVRTLEELVTHRWRRGGSR